MASTAPSSRIACPSQESLASAVRYTEIPGGGTHNWMVAGTTTGPAQTILEEVQIRTNHTEGVHHMNVKLNYIAPLLAAGAVAVAVVAAPLAAAAQPEA